MNLTLNIPDEVASELGGSEAEVATRLQTELAVVYYEARLVSAGRAAEMSGLTRGEFESLLARRGVMRSYSFEDWQSDLRLSDRKF